MRTDYIDKDVIGHILYALTPENRLICKLCLETGLRISDVLSIKISDLENNSFTIIEQKTGKKRAIRLRKALREELLKLPKRGVYVFGHRFNPNQHKTRQAVYADIKRACKAFRIKENISPHSLRKIYAVDLFQKTGDLSKVQRALNHDNSDVTLIYAVADILSKRKGRV